jgi:acyl dehydratase
LPNLVVDFDTLLTMTGKGLGTTDYRQITQEQINLFTDATDDQQWITQLRSHLDGRLARYKIP